MRYKRSSDRCAAPCFLHSVLGGISSRALVGGYIVRFFVFPCLFQRQREGIAIAKANGVYKGRKPIQPPELEKVMTKWQRREITAAAAMRQMGMSKSTFYRKARGNL